MSIDEQPPEAPTQLLPSDMIPGNELRRTLRRGTWWMVATTIVVAALAVWVWWIAVQQRNAEHARADAEQARAEQVTAEAEKLCSRLRALGAICTFNPKDFKGDRGEQGEQGEQGPPGRPPTAAEIELAVEAYLKEHPPAPGATGPPGPQGEPGSDASDFCTAHGGRWIFIRDANVPGFGRFTGYWCVT